MAFGIYLHYPFCTNLCSYCDFYKERFAPEVEQRYFSAVLQETELALTSLLPKRQQLNSVYIGGGTPSLVNTEFIEQWVGVVKRHLNIAPDLEFSFECNPESVSGEKLARLGQLGVNRPVFGVQSFDRGQLALLGRGHDPHHTYRAVYLANALGFSNFGCDLIFGLPGQNSDDLCRDVDQLLDLEPPHVSFYQLTIEPGTLLEQRVLTGAVRLPDDELMLALYQGGAERLSEAGYTRYEVSSFARPGFECRHNQNYWEGGDYLGLGPAAHSFVNGQRLFNPSDLASWMRIVTSGRLALKADESGMDQRMIEAVMLGLRTSKGINRAGFSQRFGQALEQRLNTEQYNLLVESGHVVPDRGYVRLSDEGLLVADEITRRLLR
jgi:oxygen-independent coproporphyrinogen-3 oxidase